MITADQQKTDLMFLLTPKWFLCLQDRRSSFLSSLFSLVPWERSLNLLLTVRDLYTVPFSFLSNNKICFKLCNKAGI